MSRVPYVHLDASLATARTVTRLSGPRAERALHRWQAIVRNAAEQARPRGSPCSPQD